MVFLRCVRENIKSQFKIAENNFKKAALELYTLSDYNHLIEHAITTKTIKKEHQETLVSWRKNPSTWKS